MAGGLTISTLNDSSGVLATQNGMSGIAKAWVSFNPSSGSSAVIRGSFNVSSVTYLASGNYQVNYTTAMPNANYAVVAGGGKQDTTNDGQQTFTCGGTTTTQNPTTGSAYIKTASGASAGNPAYVFLTAFA